MRSGGWLETLPPHIETVMVIDPDIRIRPKNDASTVDFGARHQRLPALGAAAFCPRVMIEPDGFLARFQSYEYALAFRVGRASLADYSITSGVSIYRRDALDRALAEHSYVGLRRRLRERDDPARAAANRSTTTAASS